MEHYPEIQRRDGTLFFACPDTDRAAIATSIERLIDMLDAMDGDPDLEPSLAGWERNGGDDREGDLDANGNPGLSEGDGNSDDEPTLGAREGHVQDDWYRFVNPVNDECEVENEHGGDIQDIPHDDIGENEESLGWANPCGPEGAPMHDWSASDAPAINQFNVHDLKFEGSGYAIARALLRKRLPAGQGRAL